MSLTRRQFCKITAGAYAASALHAVKAGADNVAGSEKPNIVFVFADQLRSFDLGCYGADHIQTPNMDRLAADGVRFTHAFSTYPICSPFRAMMMTGLYPMRNGMVCNDHYLRAGVPAFAHVCKKAGYHTGYIGKWHIDGRGRTDYIPPQRRLGFEHWMALECTHDYFHSQYFTGDSDQPRYWDGYDAEAQTHAAQAYIRDRADKGPFALFLSWGPPHDPYIAPKSYMERFKPEDIRFRPNVQERAVADALMENPRIQIPKSFVKSRNICRRWLENEQGLRIAAAGYLAATLALDDYLGQLLKTLAETGVLDNTIVVFTSDHGDLLGSHRFYGKDTPFEESISIPLLIRYPKKIPAHSTTDVLFSPIDFLPTVAGLAGVECPAVDGVDLSRVAMGRETSDRNAVLLMGMTHFCNATTVNGMDTWRGLRTHRYTYARYEDGTPWLLYDNRKDPYQMTNLAGQQESAEVIETLNEQLNRLLAKAGDPENTKALYDQIIREKPDRMMAKAYRQANPQRAL